MTKNSVESNREDGHVGAEKEVFMTGIGPTGGDSPHIIRASVSAFYRSQVVLIKRIALQVEYQLPHDIVCQVDENLLKSHHLRYVRLPDLPKKLPGQFPLELSEGSACLIAFCGPAVVHWQLELSRLGIELITKLGDEFLAWIPQGAEKPLWKKSFVVGVRVFDRDFSAQIQDPSVDPVISFKVRPFLSSQVGELADRIKALGSERFPVTTHVTRGWVRVHPGFDRHFIETVAAINLVSHVALDGVRRPRAC